MGVATTNKDRNPDGLNTRGARRLDPFDYLVLLGGVINLIVVSTIIGYWLLQ